MPMMGDSQAVPLPQALGPEFVCVHVSIVICLCMHVVI